MGFFSWGHGNLMSTWDFFQNDIVGKKSHVDIRFSHVNMGFFSQHGILEKSHVDMRFSHVNMGFFFPTCMHVTHVNMHVGMLSPAYGHTSNYSQYELSLMINTMQDWTVWRKGLFNGNLATKFYWTRV